MSLITFRLAANILFQNKRHNKCKTLELIKKETNTAPEKKIFLFALVGPQSLVVPGQHPPWVGPGRRGGGGSESLTGRCWTPAGIKRMRGKLHPPILLPQFHSDFSVAQGHGGNAFAFPLRLPLLLRHSLGIPSHASILYFMLLRAHRHRRI